MKLSFYYHASIYVVVIAALLLINLIRGGPWWSVFPLLGWGAGLLIHAVVIFGDIAGSYRENLIKKEIERMKRLKNNHDRLQ